MKRMVYWLVLIGLFVGTLWMGWTFRASNSVLVDLELIWIRVPQIELWFVILVAIAAGASFSALLLGFAWLRQRLLSARYRRAIKRLEGELHEMRSLPLAGQRSGAAKVSSARLGVGQAEEATTPDSVNVAMAEQA